MPVQNRSAPIQSLARGLALLELVGKSGRPVSLPERLANQLPWIETLRQIAREHLAALAQQTGETAHLAVREGHQAFFVDYAMTRQAVGVAGRSGHYEPLHCTALGKALLADFDRDQLVELFGPDPLESLTANTITSIAALSNECERTGPRGYADDDQEPCAGVCCVGAPIRDVSGATIGSIGISAPSERLPRSRFKQAGQIVIGAGSIPWQSRRAPGSTTTASTTSSLSTTAAGVFTPTKARRRSS